MGIAAAGAQLEASEAKTQQAAQQAENEHLARVASETNRQLERQYCEQVSEIEPGRRLIWRSRVWLGTVPVMLASGCSASLPVTRRASAWQRHSDHHYRPVPGRHSPRRRFACRAVQTR